MIKHTTLKCEQCNINFDKPTSEYRRQLKRNRSIFFCSLSCGSKYGVTDRLGRRMKLYEDAIQTYAKNPTRCITCNSSFPYKKRKDKFCNHTCSAKSTNVTRIRKRKHEKPCKNCSVVHYKVGPFCKHACSVEYRCNETEKAISEGQVVGPVPLKKYLIKTRGHKCEMCDITEWNNQPVMVIMDHINGDSTNNKLTNLRLLCSNCDAQTPTYKSRNKGNGRHSRRQRYAENKSY
jgi:hypothetical protein